MLLDMAEAGSLSVGEVVTCAVWLYERKAPQSWGKGRVVRIEASRIAIDFR
jgi:hypothetical protein